MKLFLLLFMSLSLLTNVYAEAISQEQIKEALIDKSYKGDVKAMVELGNKFKFYQSVGGLHSFKEWYSSALESTNGDDVFAFSKVYEAYMSTDINGPQRYLQLLKRASDLNNRAATLQLSKFYTYIKKSDASGNVANPLMVTTNVLEHTFFYNKQKSYLGGQEPVDQLHARLMKIGTKKDLENMLSYYSRSFYSKAKLKAHSKSNEIKEALDNKRYQPENVKSQITKAPEVQYYDSNQSFVWQVFTERFSRQSVSSIIHEYNLNRYDDKLIADALKTGDVTTALEIASFYPSLEWPQKIKNFQKSIDLYNTLVDYESVLAMLALADFYDNPPHKLISRSSEQAIYYYTKAAKFGSEKAAIRLKELGVN